MFNSRSDNALSSTRASQFDSASAQVLERTPGKSDRRTFDRSVLRSRSSSRTAGLLPVRPFQESVDKSRAWKATVFKWNGRNSDRPSTTFFAQGLNSSNAIGVVNLGANRRSDGKNGIRFNWGSDTPGGDDRFPRDYFAVHATTQVDLDGGSYRFRVKGNDGFRLFARNQDTGKRYAITPKNRWTSGSSTFKTINYRLPEGRYDMVFTYYDKTGSANFDLSWGKVGSGNSSQPNPRPGQSGSWENPLPGYPVTSEFGPRTYWDGSKWVSSNHKGIDIGTGDETPAVESARKGQVVYAATGWNGGFGNLVEIDHGNGLLTRYAHLSKINVREGDRVDADSVIGYVGRTGTATGNHLHFEVVVNGESKNPKQFLAFA